MAFKIYKKNNYCIIDDGSLKKYLSGDEIALSDSGNGNWTVINSSKPSESVSFNFSVVQDESGVSVGTAEQVEEYLTLTTNFSPDAGNSSALITDIDIATLAHFVYNPLTDKLEADRAIETTLNSLFLGEQHKMSSGAENIFFTNLGNDTNFYPVRWIERPKLSS